MNREIRFVEKIFHCQAERSRSHIPIGKPSTSLRMTAMFVEKLLFPSQSFSNLMKAFVIGTMTRVTSA